MNIYFSPRKFLNNYLKPILVRVSKKNKEVKRNKKLSKRSRESPSRMGWKDSGLIWEDYDKLYQP